ncbi:MAG TPA: hypothetical protein VN799_09825, partial [Acidimicrobiales bacterium]|nr:hypothetical protein [Acidimicrobiales bacterium]
LARRTLGALPPSSPAGRARSRSVPPPPPPAPIAAPSSPATTAPPATTTAEPSAGIVTSPAAATVTQEVSRDALVELWGDSLLASLPNRARARFRVGRFVAVEGGTAVFALPNETHRSYCEEVRLDVETALGGHFGIPVPLRLVVDEETDTDAPPRPAVRSTGANVSAPDAAVEHDEVQPDLLDPHVLAAETRLAGAGPTPEERLKLAFPGAEEV